MVCGVIFGVKYQILATKTEMLGKQLFLGCMCGCFGALMGPRWSGMVDMLIPDKFEIGFSKEMICRVIFGVKYQILITKTDVRESAVSWVYVWPFWGSDGAPDGWEW